MSGHSIPIALMWIGSQLGHLKLEPSAPPSVRKTPNPGRVWNEPSPLNWKLRASPPITSPPTVTCAPIDAKPTSGSFGPAPVSTVKFFAVSVSTDPRLMTIVSARNLNAEMCPSVNSSVARTASVSESLALSVIVAETGRPGRNDTPPEAMKMSPLNDALAPDVNEKFSRPRRMSLKRRMSPKPIVAGAGVAPAPSPVAVWPGR